MRRVSPLLAGMAIALFFIIDAAASAARVELI
jgi:hypothetical protein